MFSNKSPKVIGLIQALGLMLYIIIVATVITLLGQKQHFVNETLSIISALMFFVASALVSASIILGYPVTLFFNDKKDKAVKIVIWSAVWLLALTVFVLLVGWLWSIK